MNLKYGIIEINGEIFVPDIHLMIFKSLSFLKVKMESEL